ncbi:MAG: copper transporter [Actinomycetota bacterium]
MISFRYHIVTIVAVFLALAVGLLAGSAFVQPALQDELEQQTEDLQRANDELRRQIDEVRTELASVQGFAEAALPYLAENRLLGTSAVIVAVDGVDEAVLGQTQQALAMGGTELVAVVAARPSLVAEDAETQALLAEILGVPAAEPSELAAAAAAEVATRLASGVDGESSEDDLLSRLLSAGFLDTTGSEGTLEEIGVPGQIVVVLGGGPSEAPTLPPEAFAVPLVDELSLLGVPVAAGESTTTPAAVSFVAGVRDGGADGIVTVDDLDLSMGGAALVLGMDRLLATGVGGAYGIRDGAEPLPPLS